MVMVNVHAKHPNDVDLYSCFFFRLANSSLLGGLIVFNVAGYDLPISGLGSLYSVGQEQLAVVDNKDSDSAAVAFVVEHFHEGNLNSFGLIKPESLQMNEIISWLGRWFLIKTFDKLDECDVAEIRKILDQDDDES